MVRNLALATTVAFLVGAGAAAAQIVPGTPGGGGAAPPPAQPGGGGIIPGAPPGPAAGAETELDKQFKALLIGSWHLNLQAPPGWQAWVDAAYSTDGTFFARQISVSPNGQSETTLSGTYVVKAIDRSNFTLTLTYTTPPGAPQSSDVLTYTDQNTLYSTKARDNATRIQ